MTVCERTHNHIKSLVKFDVRKVNNTSKRLYVLANFMVYQTLILGKIRTKFDRSRNFHIYPDFSSACPRYSGALLAYEFPLFLKKT